MESKFFKIENKRLKIIATFVLLLFIVVYACHEELGNSIENESNKKAIELAKSWYEMNKPALPAFRSSDRSVEIPMKPEWSRASYKKNDKYEIVETDIMTFGGIMFAHPECVEKYNETQDEKYRRSYSRLVFRTDRETNKTVGFLMTQIPNPEFLEKSNFKPFKKTNYLERDKDFGGWIVFHNLDGSFSNGWEYEKGKITGKIKYMDNGDVGLSFRSAGCRIVDMYLYNWSCPWWFTGGEMDDFLGNCIFLGYVFLYQTMICDNEDDGNNDPGSGGGYNPPTPPDPPEVILIAPKVITIMDSYNLSVSVANIDCQMVEFKINDYYTLQKSGSTICNEKAKKAGFWTIKAIVNGSYYSDEEEIEVQYPEVGTISGKSIVSTAMSSAWSATKSLASSGMREIGFAIFVNTATMSYECDQYNYGPIIYCEDKDPIPFRFPSTESISGSPLIGGKYIVAMFHTHTPYTYCSSSYWRGTGPSETDISSHSTYPGMVYDYVDTIYIPYSGLYVIGGHDINAAATIFYCGQNRRTTPY